MSSLRKEAYSLSKQKLCSSNIFLTGATGVLGGHLLKELLQNTKSNIYCLVRAENEELGRLRLLSFLKAYDPKLLLYESFMKRAIPVLGNIAHDKLGMCSKSYRDLTEKIDITIHAAALTNLFLNYRRVEPVNVGGTKNAIQFALHTRQKYLSYVSTYTVMGDKTFDKSVVFKETDFDIGQDFDHMNYQKSKFTAEKLVREATRHGLLWNIFRPGQIFGEAKTGHYPQGQSNVSGLFYDIFKTVIDTGVALESRTHFDVVPVDYVSQGTLRLTLNTNNFFQTYHFTNPDVKPYNHVIQLIRDFGYPIEVISQSEYKTLLFKNLLTSNGVEYKSSTTSAFKWWFKRENFSFSESAITDCTFTAKQLLKSKIVCQNIDSDLIGTYLTQGIRQNYFPKPKFSEKRREHQMPIQNDAVLKLQGDL
jgi:polyketide synthase PksN